MIHSSGASRLHKYLLPCGIRIGRAIRLVVLEQHGSSSCTTFVGKPTDGAVSSESFVPAV